MSAMQPVIIDCPMCGALIGWNPAVSAAPVQDDHTVFKARLTLTLDDLSARRHRRCGILPPAAS